MWLLAAALGGCGDSPTQPTQPAAGVVLHDTMNSPESRGATRLYESETFVDTFGRQMDGGWAIDDFTPSRSGSIRTVRWQGGYCDPRFQVPLAIPTPVARSFRITFTHDVGGSPGSTHTPNVRPLFETTVPLGDVHETKMFEVLQDRELGCGSKVPAPHAYYGYTLTLPTTLTVAAGEKYWFRVMADIGVPTVMWGRRGGSGGDGRSYSSYANASYLTDMAFSLTQ